METAHAAVMIKCPHCGNKFSSEDAICHEIRVEVEKELEARYKAQLSAMESAIRKQEAEKLQSKLQVIEEERRQKQQRVRELEQIMVTVEQRELQVKSREEQLDLEMKRRLLERERIIRQESERTALEKAQLEFREKELRLMRERESQALQAQKRMQEEIEKARAEERLHAMELQKKLDDQSRLVMEMKKRNDQGSMQMQGEVQELAIEDFLQSSFPRDVIEEVAKGKRGGDCVHVVMDDFNRICGRIVYESKRTKHFSAEWIAKLKDDVRLRQADLGVIVTEAFPEGMTRFGERDGIWICSFTEFRALAHLFRHMMLRVGEVSSAQENKGEKTAMIYNYITGNEFRQKLEAAFESFYEMQEDLQKEKTLMVSQWAKREKKLFKAMENLVSLYGDVRGIAGGAVQEISMLEIPQLEA